jgi:hypothetical protein
VKRNRIFHHGGAEGAERRSFDQAFVRTLRTQRLCGKEEAGYLSAKGRHPSEKSDENEHEHEIRARFGVRLTAKFEVD